jgi:DNA-binding PadR family transcriptional regulator
MGRLKRSLTTENLWLYILSILSRKKLHGYAVLGEMEKRFGWKPGLVTPYVVMYKLEAEGLIKAKRDERRVYYEVTPLGKKALKEAKKYINELSRKI